MSSVYVSYRDYDHAALMNQGYAFTIDTEGHWFCHDPAMGAGPIKREAISKLFSGAGQGFMAGKGLSIDENGTYWVTSPPDRYKVHVEDVPFVLTDYEVEGGELVFRTNFDEKVLLDSQNSFVTRPAGPYPDIPYLHVRTGLMARLGRALFYNLVARASEREGGLFISSGGVWHSLGSLQRKEAS